MKNCSLVIGRFQGFTNKHEELIEESLKDFKIEDGLIKHDPETIVGLVNGEKSSIDKERNPFTFAEKVKMIRKVFPHIKCIKLSNGFIGEILDVTSGIYYNLSRICTGEDRAKGYYDQIKNEKYFVDWPYRDIQLFVLTRTGTSGTEFRKCLRTNDKKRFEQIVPYQLWEDFDELRNIYIERIKEKN